MGLNGKWESGVMVGPDGEYCVDMI